MRLLLLTALSLLPYAAESAADDAGERLEAYMQRAAEAGFTGGVAVARRGEILLRRAYGERIPGTGEENTPATVSTVGSITKQFTAAAVLRLVEEGRLQLDDRLGDLLDGAPPDKADITVHELLTHQSGLPPAIGPDSERIGRDDYLREAFGEKLLFEPGSGYEYSNVGYSVLAAIIEQVSGTEFEQFLRTELFRPAGMAETGYALSEGAVSRLAHGIDDDGEDWGSVYDLAISDQGPGWHLVGNGGIHSTLDDMLAWHAALQGDEILSEQSKRLLYGRHAEEPGGTWYGYGWSIEETPWGATLITHNGGNPYFFADFLRFPGEDIVIYLWTTSREARLKSIGRPLAQIVFGGPTPPLPPPAAPLIRIGSEPVPPAGSDMARWNLPATREGSVAARFLTALRTSSGPEREAAIARVISDRLIETGGIQKIESILDRIRSDLGDFRLLGIRQPTPDRVDVEFDAITGRGAIELDVEGGEHARVDGIGVRLGD